MYLRLSENGGIFPNIYSYVDNFDRKDCEEASTLGAPPIFRRNPVTQSQSYPIITQAFNTINTQTYGVSTWQIISHGSSVDLDFLCSTS